MPHTNAIDRIIRLVDSNHEQSSSSGKRIIIDLNNAEIFQHPPFFKWGKELRYYIVSSQNIVECDGLECKVRDKSTRNSINIMIEYDVSCPAEAEEKVVKALCNGDNPKIVLEDYIKRWVKEFDRLKRSEGINFITSFFSEKSTLQEYITEKALDETGLELYPYISLKGEENLEVIKLTSKDFVVRVKDFDSDILIKYEIGLEVLENEDKINAILSYSRPSRLQSIIKNEVEKFIIKECYLHDLCYNFDAKIKPELIAKIDYKLREDGRRTSYIKFDLQVFNLIAPEIPMVTHTTECKIKDSQTAISVNNRVLMRLENLGKFRKAEIQDLEAWLRIKLDKVVQEVFFERDRIDLLRNISVDEDLIQKYLQKEAEQIGYTVKSLILLPKLEELTLTQGFKVEKKSAYRTKDNLEIKLELIINGRIENFNGIEAHLKDGTEKFKDRIADTAVSIIEQEIREHYTAKIYENAMEGDSSIDNLLKTKVRSSIESNFKLINTSISIRFLDTDWTKRMNNLKAAFPKFEVNIKPYRTPYSIPYKISYVIRGVHPQGFPTFQANALQPDETDKEIALINEKMVEELEMLMNTIPIEVIRYEGIKILKKISEIVIPALEKVAINSFGLVVSEVKIRRLQSIGEIAALEKLEAFIELGLETELKTAEELKNTTIARLEELHELEKAYFNIGDKKELKKIKHQKEELLRQLSKYMDNYNKQQENLKIDTENESGNSSFSFDDFHPPQIEAPKKNKDNQ